MKNYLKAQIRKDFLWWSWVLAFTAYNVAEGFIHIYRGTFDGQGWVSAGIGDLLFAALFLSTCFLLRSNRKYRALFTDIFSKWNATIKDNQRLIKLCEKFRLEIVRLKKEKDEKRS